MSPEHRAPAGVPDPTGAPAHALAATLARSSASVTARPELARHRSRAVATTVAGTATRVGVSTGRHRLTVDEPTSAGGGDHGPSPVDLAAAALGSCQAVTYRCQAARLGVPLDEVSVEVDTDLDLAAFLGVTTEAGPARLTVRTTLHGPAADADYVHLHAVVEATCPVLALLAGTDVRVHPPRVVRTPTAPEPPYGAAR